MDCDFAGGIAQCDFYDSCDFCAIFCYEETDRIEKFF